MYTYSVFFFFLAVVCTLAHHVRFHPRLLHILTAQTKYNADNSVQQIPELQVYILILLTFLIET